MQTIEEIDDWMRVHAPGRILGLWNRYRTTPRTLALQDDGIRAGVLLTMPRGRWQIGELSPEMMLMYAITPSLLAVMIDASGHITVRAGQAVGRAALHSFAAEGAGERMASVLEKCEPCASGDFVRVLGSDGRHGVHANVAAAAGMRLLHLAGLMDCPEAPARDALFLMLRRHEGGRLYRDLAPLRRGLDQGLRRFMAESDLPAADGIYNWLHGGDGEIGKRRRQAATTFPMLISWLLQSGRYACETAALRRAIDKGEPLLVPLANTLGVRPATIRHLRTLQRAEQRVLAAIDTVTLIRWLDGIPCEQWPRGKQACLAFRQVAEDRPVHQLLPDETGHRAVQALLRLAAKGGWEQGLERHRRRFPHSGRLISFADTCESIRRYCALDNTAGEDDDEVLSTRVAELLGGLDYRGMIDISEAWHRAIREQEDGDHEGYAWPPLSETFTHAGRRLEPLCNGVALAREGRALEHCVGGYVHACLFGHSHIVACRDGDGRARSTLEIALKRQAGALRPHLIQHRGESNRQPEAACRQAVAAYMRELERLPPGHWKGLDRQRMARRDGETGQTCRRQLRQREGRILARALPSPLFAAISELVSEPEPAGEV